MSSPAATIAASDVLASAAPPRRPRPVPTAILRGHGSAVTSAHFLSPGTHLLTGDEHGTIRLWDIRYEETVSVIVLDDADPILSISTHCSLSSHMVVIQQKGHAPQLLHVERTTLQGALSQSAHACARGLDPSFWMSFCRVRRTDEGFVAGGSDGRLALLGVSGGTLTVGATGTTSGGMVMGVTGAGRRVGVAQEDGMLSWWDYRSSTIEMGTKVSSEPLTSIMNIGDMAIVAGADRNVSAVMHTRIVSQSQMRREGVAEMTGTGRVVVTAGWDGVVRVWDARRRRESLLRAIVGLRWHEGGVRCVAASSNGECVVSGGDDCTVALWDANL